MMYWTDMESDPHIYTLPAPDLRGLRPFEEVLSQRRSRRIFSGETVTVEEISQILWAANGISEIPENPRRGIEFRTAPSAGATYPLEVYLLAGNITGIDPGVYRRSTNVYGHRGSERYVCMDLGHAAQNVYLQAEALHLGTCAIGAFNDLLNESRAYLLNYASALASLSSQARFPAACGGVSEHNINKQSIDD